MKHRARHQGLGLGLVEMLIALVVLGVVAVIAAPSFSDMMNRRRVQGVATALSTDIAYMRTEQSLRATDLAMYINLTPGSNHQSCYAVGLPLGLDGCVPCGNAEQTGKCLLMKQERLPTSKNVSFVAANVGGTNASIFGFNGVRMTPKPAKTFFDVCGAASGSPRAVLRVEMNAAGRTSICSPNASMSGYGACSLSTDADTPPPGPQCPAT